MLIHVGFVNSYELISPVISVIMDTSFKAGEENDGYLYFPKTLVLPVYPARAVRYFLTVLTAGILWPQTFRYFSRLGVKR